MSQLGWLALPRLIGIGMYIWRMVTPPSKGRACSVIILDLGQGMEVAFRLFVELEYSIIHSIDEEFPIESTNVSYIGKNGNDPIWFSIIRFGMMEDSLPSAARQLSNISLPS